MKQRDVASGSELALRDSVTQLSEMNMSDLTDTARALDRYQEKIESMSGIVATMRGLVFIVAKERLGHGKFIPWLAENFNKTRKTATQDMRVAREFVKCNPRLHFKELADALRVKSREPELDLSNPLVSEVATWVKGRPRFQLLLDFPASRGGDTSWAGRKKLSPEAEHAEWLALCKEHFAEAIMSLDELIEKKQWQATSITDAEREAAADLAREFARQVVAFNKLPKRDRSAPARQQFEVVAA